MARAINRLTTRSASALKEPGMHADGRGLYLCIDQTGGKRWTLIFHRHGRRREMGLGSFLDVGLSDAREAAEEARALIRAGKDPIEERRAAKSPPVGRSFSEVASTLLDDISKGWKWPRQRAQFEASLKTHAPAIWKMDVADVDTEAVIAALRPIWTTQHETATRVRMRIERVLDAAKVMGLRSGDNPARWRGHLSILMIKPQRTKSHFAAMPYEDVPAFMGQIMGRHSSSALAMRFLILTAARSGEVRGATWDEIEGDIWRIPGARMKAGREHVVPLSHPARALLNSFDQSVRQGLIFPGQNGELTDMALLMLLRKMKITDATPHGFRSSFRDWAGDCTHYPRELAEAALAHSIGNAVERAYRRRDALAKRKALMEDWAAFCMGEKAGKVLAFPGA